MLDEILADVDERFERTFESLRRDTSKLRTGRAHPSLLDGIRIDYYGTPTPLSQLANVSVVDARLLQIKPWERTVCSAIEKAIQQSDLGLTPNNRGDLILLPVPALTGERRRELVKVLKNEGEKAKISMRQGRRDALDLIDLIEDMSDDDLDRGRKAVQDRVDAIIRRVDAYTAEKEIEITAGP
jgi:ribosome recycling factor